MDQRDVKKTSSWFILLFPIAIPAMIVLDYLGYRIIALIILAVLVLSFIYYIYSVFTKFRSLRGAFISLAEAICDPDSWTVRHYPYHHTLSGSARGHRFHYSLLGHDERALCQLFLEGPVADDFFLEAGREPEHPAGETPRAMQPVLRIPGFRSLRALPQKVSSFRRILDGLAGSGGPGLVLRKQVDDPFAAPALKRDFELLLDIARTLAHEPWQGKEGN